MSRIIKFRCWCPDTKRLFALDLFHLNEDGADWTLEGRDKDSRACSVWHPESFVLQQFTGLLDKTGRDIYEGDLVNFTVRGVTHGPEAEDIKSGEVYWSDEDACWLFGRYHQPGHPYPRGPLFGQSSEPYDWGYSMADRIDIKTFEVVGNIFDRAAARELAAPMS